MQTRADGCCRWRRSATGWIVAKRPGSGPWIARRCAIGFTGSTLTARKVSSTIGWAGRSPRLSAEQLAQFARIVEAGPDREKDGVVRWRRIDLKGAIGEKFGVEFHERYVGKLLKKLGFSHPAQNERVVEALKNRRARNHHLYRMRNWAHIGQSK